MSQAFLDQLSQCIGKRVSLALLRTLWLEADPLQIHVHNRDKQMLAALEEAHCNGVLTLPAPRSYEKFGSPPMPAFVTLVREARPKPVLNYLGTAWGPELGFWPSLAGTELATAHKINEWLIRRRNNFRIVPLRERSLDIFGDEKYLDSRVRNGALFSGRMPLSVIGAMRVEHPLAYRPADAVGQPVLVVENHHTFWSLGEWNEDVKRYSAIVFGSGNTLCASGLALTEVMREREATHAEYFGDLDPEGISIPLKFNKINQQQLSPALLMYRWLLRVGRQKAGVMSNADGRLMLNLWLPELAADIFRMWDDGKWMPQEGLGLEALMSHGD
jgi:hypothetical protein